MWNIGSLQIQHGNIVGCQIQKLKATMLILYSPWAGNLTSSLLTPCLLPSGVSYPQTEVKEGVSSPPQQPHWLQCPLPHLPSSQQPWLMIGAHAGYVNEGCEVL